MGFFDFMKPVEFNADGTVKKEKKKTGGGKKAPSKSKNNRTAKEEQKVKMFLTYVSDLKYELADAEEFLTDRERKSMITLLNRAVDKLEK